jgi:2-alkenal reductase
MTEPIHFEPEPEQRVQWQAGAQQEGTPERWFEPDPQPGAPHQAVTRGLLALIVSTSLVAGLVGAGATFLVLRQMGGLGTVGPTPQATLGVGVSVQSESDAVIAAAARIGPAAVTLVAETAAGQVLGSGVIFDAAGWILTNRHVVESAGSVQVHVADGRSFPGRVYGMDTLTDLAILKIDGASKLTAAWIGTSSGLRVGQLTIAIGSPLGPNYPNSVTSGIVSALGRDVTVTSDSSLSAGSSLHGLIQTDAAINSGNSGGPLVDASGRVIGITTSLGGSAEGIGFAIPIDIAKPIMQQALAGAKLARPYIGISFVQVDQGLAAKENLPVDHGAWVHKVDAGGNPIEAVVADSPAAKAGIKTGDVIVAIEGQTIDASHPLDDALVQFAPGRTIDIELIRNSRQQSVMVTLGVRPEAAS